MELIFKLLVFSLQAVICLARVESSHRPWLSQPAVVYHSDNRLSDDIDTPGTSGSSKDLSEQVLHDVEPLIHVPFVVLLYGISLKYIHS